MSEPRTARLVAAERFADSRLMRFQMNDGSPLAFRGGQYLIVDTGLSLPDGKRRKRAFSVLSPDSDLHEFELAVRHIDNGLGSEWMLALELGAELRFSGPWGKLSAPERGDVGPAWVLATDSGLTAALGLVRAQSFQPHLARTRFIWWAPCPQYFLCTDLFRACLPPCQEASFDTLPEIGSAQRLLDVDARLRDLATQGLPSRVYVIGDGHVATRAREHLLALGMESSAIQSESFFHHTVRKASPTQAA